MRYLIIYDISDDKRRRKVFKTLKSYGAWKQYSAFEVNLTKTQKTELKHQMEEFISKTDKIRIYRICKNCKENIEEIGKKSDNKKSQVV